MRVGGSLGRSELVGLLTELGAELDENGKALIPPGTELARTWCSRCPG